MYSNTTSGKIFPFIALKIILLMFAISASADWAVVMRQVGCDTSSDVTDIFFLEKTPTQADGWAVGKNGLLMRLTDSGIWRVEENGVKNDLNGIFFIDSLNGWVVGNRGVMLHTTDGGKTWLRQMLRGNSTPAPTDSDVDLFAVHFISETSFNGDGTQV